MFRNADCEDGGDPLHPKDGDDHQGCGLSCECHAGRDWWHGQQQWTFET